MSVAALKIQSVTASMLAPVVALPSASQLAAIEADPGPLLVLAGPGAGKTFCLIERIRFLIARHDADPARICAFTFTNKAAGRSSIAWNRHSARPLTS
jgi:superfamily I DNA/RNA helicase